MTTLPCRLYGLRMGKVKVTTRALRTALAATLGAALASTGTAAAAGRLQQQGPGTGDGPDPNAPRCKQLPVTSDRWIVPGNGDHAPTPGSPSNPNAVELRGFSTPDKPSFTQVLPSPDFDPANASSATMSALGFPTKPEAKSDLAKWKHDVEHSTTRRFGLCEVAGAHFTTDASSSWAGTVASHSTNAVREVYGEWKSPSMVSYCPHRSDDSTWVGTGGWHAGTGYLAQDGFSAVSGVYNSTGPIDQVIGWVEALGSPLNGGNAVFIDGYQASDAQGGALCARWEHSRG